MKVGTIIRDISPAGLSEAVIDMDLTADGVFHLVQHDSNMTLKTVSLEVIKNLDERNCIVWDSPYLHDKALQLLTLDELLPASFESGPDMSNMSKMGEEAPEASSNMKLDKLLLPIVVFVAAFLLILFIVALLSAGTGILEIFSQSGIFVVFVSVVVSLAISYFTLWRKKS